MRITILATITIASSLLLFGCDLNKSSSEASAQVLQTSSTTAIGTDLICNPADSLTVLDLYTVPSGYRFILTDVFSQNGNTNIYRSAKLIFIVSQGFSNFKSGWQFASGEAVEIPPGACASVSGYLIQT